ncbi:dynamin-related protein 4C-like [Punica granatum]|uniref:Dynamin-related protein 4C-like n=2 Tax=Punica granatum TaxID=22663 RepID=A0A6P8E770_PUNGR|nr:dynamin-related protein 4C-like [Punica granatum]
MDAVPLGSEEMRLNNSDNQLSNGFLAIVRHPEPRPLVAHPPIVSSYNDRIRPILDAVDRLRNLQVMKEGIQLPTIVVVGDQSSGKSSVLESLAGINLPRGQGICTRVPLIMRLQNHPCPDPELYLEFNGKLVVTDEDNVTFAISSATEQIAGRQKGISNTPLTLVVKKDGVPDLTMVDLPGITRVPVHGQPENIYEQISEMIMEYIRPEESIILNVLSATVDFSTCESIRMSQMVDKTGHRTLAVVTKADKAPEGLLEKVTADDVNIGLGYVCVRNRIGDETYEEARMEEVKLFDAHPLLSKIDKSIVGIPVLSEKLMQIQATIVAKCLPEIVRKINEKLNINVAELNKMPKVLSTVAEAMTAFMQIMGSAKDSLRKILLRGEYDEYPHEKQMHGTARFVEMLDRFANELRTDAESGKNSSFLMEEISLLEEAKGIRLPNFIPRTAFLTILHKKVEDISCKPFKFMGELWDYIELVVITVLMDHSKNYPPLQACMRRAAQNLIAKMKERAMIRVTEIIEMEKLTDYTCDPEYISEWNKLMGEEPKLLAAVNNESFERPSAVSLEGIGVVEIDPLRQLKHQVKQAFDLKMRMTSYWKIVKRRLVDTMAMFLLFNVQVLVNREMEGEIVNDLVGPHGGGIERMLEEPPSVANKREKLKRSIKLLRESADIVATIIHRAAANADLE